MTNSYFSSSIDSFIKQLSYFLFVYLSFFLKLFFTKVLRKVCQICFITLDCLQVHAHT